MRPPIDVLGKKYGRLFITENLPSRRSDGGQMRRFVRARCDCGKDAEVMVAYLLTGKTGSCGCLQRELISARKTTHGETRDGPTAEYTAWANMIGRCENPKRDKYRYYGGRGITICKKWRESYEAFLADMGRKPSPKHSIDRFPNNDGNYEPSNCRWATRKEQMRNKSNHHLVTYQGKTMPISAWEEELGMCAGTIKSRFYAGWSVHRALTEPLRGTK